MHRSLSVRSLGSSHAATTRCDFNLRWSVPLPCLHPSIVCASQPVVVVVVFYFPARRCTAWTLRTRTPPRWRSSVWTATPSLRSKRSCWTPSTRAAPTLRGPRLPIWTWVRAARRNHLKKPRLSLERHNQPIYEKYGVGFLNKEFDSKKKRGEKFIPLH